MAEVTDIIISSIDEVKKSIKDLRNEFIKRDEELNKRFNSLMTKSECNNKMSNLEKFSELSIKKVIAVGGVITGVITTSTATIVTILKIFYGG